MFKKDTRKGVSLGSIFALIASMLFVGGAAAPASAADGESSVVMDPQVGTSFTTFITEDFQLVTRLGTGVNGNLVTKLKWRIEKPAGVQLSYSQAVGTSALEDGPVNGTAMSGASTQSVVAVSGATTTSGTIPSSHVLAIGLFSASAGAQNTITSQSASITVHITPWLDIDGDGVVDTSEPQGDRQAVVFAPWSILGATVDIAAVAAGATTLTGSSTVNLSAVNLHQLTNSFYIEVIGNDDQVGGAVTLANYGQDSLSSAVSGATLANKSSTYMSISSTTLVPINPVSYSVRLYYGTAAQSTQLAVKNISSAEETVSTLSISPVVGTNVTADWKLRPNQTYTVRVHAKTGSASVSNTVVTMALSGPDLSVGVKEISINGAASTTSYPTALTATTDANGFASFTLKTFGFENEDAITLTANKGATNTSGTLTTYDPVYTLASDYTYYATTPGASVAVAYTVEDQWGVASSRTDQRVKVDRGTVTGFNWAETISYVAVSGGATSFTFVGQPAAATGSVTLTATLQRQNSNNGTWATDSGSANATTTINVSGAANAFGTGLAVSYAASVSYFADTVSWTTITGTVTNTGSAVVVSADSSVIFRASAALPTTTSGGITVQAGSGGTYTFQVTSLLEGTKTLTLTNGSATTTSQIVTNDVRSDYGSTITWDTTTIVAGRTKIITGTLLDANGNPVDTTNPGSTVADSAGSASIVVTYQGTAGIVVGSVPTETDAEGKFRISVLTSATDNGTLTFTAVYLPQGASTVTANKVTSVNAVTVGAGDTSASADQKVNAGSFKGYVAIYAKGYEGQRLSAKVGNDWVVVPSLASNFVRVVEYTGAGYTIAVRIYIDRVLVDTITVTTK